MAEYQYQLLLIFLYFIPLNIKAEMVLIIDKFEMCDDKDYALKIEFNCTKTGKDDVFNMDIKNTVNIDDDYTLETMLFVSRDGENYKRIFTTKNKFCKALKMDLGDFVYKKMEMAGILSKCPFPKGHYLLHNSPLEFNMLRIQNLPSGYMKSFMRIYNKAKQLVHCTTGHVTIKYL